MKEQEKTPKINNKTEINNLPHKEFKALEILKKMLTELWNIIDESGFFKKKKKGVIRNWKI